MWGPPGGVTTATPGGAFRGLTNRSHATGRAYARSPPSAIAPSARVLEHRTAQRRDHMTDGVVVSVKDARRATRVGSPRPA
jgi:hypothetical protein